MATTDQPDETPGKILDHDAGIGAADEEQVERRARELASIAGLSRDESVDDFREQARQELSGRADPLSPNDEDDAVADLTEPDDVPGESGGATVPVSDAASNDDDETIGEVLYSEGITEAAHDQMVESREEERRREE